MKAEYYALLEAKRQKIETDLQQWVASQNLLDPGETLKFTMELTSKSVVTVDLKDISRIVTELPPDDASDFGKSRGVWRLTQADWDKIRSLSWDDKQAAFLELLYTSNNGPVQQSQISKIKVGGWSNFMWRFNKALRDMSDINYEENRGSIYFLKLIAPKSGSYAIRKYTYD